MDAELGAIRLNSNSKIIADDQQLFSSLRRVQINDYCKKEGWDVQEVADLCLAQLDENGSVLVIVNTKKSALELYQLLSTTSNARVYHLSTNMCPAHRKKILKTICGQLSSTSHEPIICISTQLIEAGVDVDFGCVIRYLAGLDSIAQAAGRCNRHGKRIDSLAPVFVVNPSTENIDKLHDIKCGQKVTERILNEFRNDPESLDSDLLSPKAIERFYEYYFFKRSEEMVYPISAKTQNIGCETNLLELLSKNESLLESYKRENDSAPNLVLHQAFRTAGSAFEVIDAPTRGVIVSYGPEGKEIITELVAVFTTPNRTIQEKIKLLRKAQQFSVNVFSHQLNSLHKAGCIKEISDSGIYCLDERHYNDAFGISLEETMSMAFLNF